MISTVARGDVVTPAPIAKLWPDGCFAIRDAAGTLHQNDPARCALPRRPFSTFKLQHFVPTRRRLVITDADPDRRIVRTIDGYPAATAYAELVGLPVEALAAGVFSTHPVMVRLGDEYYVRSIQKVNADGSLTFYCAIEEGLVLTIGEGVDALRTLTDAFVAIEDAVKRPQLVIACDCILRRLELEHDGLADEVGRFLAQHRVVGFCTYGEQYYAMHVNQTLVGVAIGEA